MNGRAPVRLMSAARAVNDYMPIHLAELVADALREAGRKIVGARVAVLGYTYLEESDDTRNSPSEMLVTKLHEMDVEVVIHDPWVPEYQGDLLERVKDCDAAVVMVAHRVYKALDLTALKNALRAPVLIDGRRVFNAELVQAAGFLYRAVGLGVQAI